MPAEFSAHAGCWMAWPDRPDNWRLNAEPAQREFANVAEAIARFEPVTMLANRDSHAQARAALPGQIRVIETSYDDCWMRDIGPTFVVNDAGEVRGIDWKFNAWGGLYQPFDQDDAVAAKICDIERLARYRAPMVCEGGALHVDGEGTCIVTEETLLNPNRNPEMGKTAMERVLKQHLGVTKVIWLKHGVYGDDDTSGHVDNLCCFVRPGVLALTWTADPGDAQYSRSMDALKRLRKATDARGRAFEIHLIHQPGPLHVTREEYAGVAGTFANRSPNKRMAASYINFYIAGSTSGNGGIILPAFDDTWDAAALKQMQQLFPKREVVQVYARDILLGGGNIHCITQQQPRSGRQTRRKSG